MDNSLDVADAAPDPSQQRRRTGATRPVTIRQLAQTDIREELTKGAPKLRYRLHGVDFHIATFVGNIVTVVTSGETSQTIRIEDGTGRISSTLTTTKDEEVEDPPKWRAGVYVRVFGVPRTFNQAIVFETYFIRPVEDPHEVFFHLMEAAVVTLQHSRGQPPRLHDSKFAKIAGPTLSPLAADQDLSVSMRTLALDSPPLQSGPLQVASTSQIDDYPHEDASDDEDGSTEYYTDQPPDSPFERSPSSTPAPYARNHSFEGHSDRDEGPSQSTQNSKVRSSDEESDNERTPKGKSKLRRKDDGVPRSPKEGSDEELQVLRSEFSSQIIPSTPPRYLKPDPYTGWSPAKRNVMVFIHSKAPGEEVDVKRALGEGMSKVEMRNAIRELVKEGKIETGDGINYRLTDKGPRYPRF